MSKRRHLVAAGLLPWLAACQTIEANSDIAAVIDTPTDAGRAELQAVVNAALHTQVLLAPDALTKSSVLVIEHTPPRTMDNPVPMGRDPGRPLRFRLVVNESQCILVDERNQQRHELSNISCRPE